MLDGLLTAFNIGSIPLLLVATYVGSCFIIVSHEFGHYFAARYFGIKIRRVVIRGCGPVYLKRHKGAIIAISTVILPWKDSGVLLYQPQVLPRYAVACALFAGPATNLLAGALLWFIATWLDASALLFVALLSAGNGVVQLIPGGASDGQLIWNVYRHNKFG